MNLRTLASIVFAVGLAWGCGSPDLSAAQAEAATPAATGDSTPTAVAAAPTAVAQSVSRPSQSTQATTTTSTPAATPTTNPLLARTVRILALGDSMTAGHEDDPTRFRSYRGRLHQMLVGAGYNVDFVGTQKMTPAIGGDPDHDGYGGAWIGPGGSGWNLTDMLPRILPAVDPDIIILALGWNSVYNEASVAGQKYRDFVNRVAAAKPNAHIVVATLSPQRGQTEAQSTADLPGYGPLNAAARSLASASPTDRIHLADYATAGFQDAEYWDVIHWLQPGADRAARVLYQTLVNGPLAPSTTAPAAPSTATAPSAAASPPDPTVPPATTGATNSVDTIVDDMKLNNDLTLAGVPLERGWATGPGQVVMGNDPRGTRTPTWWNPANRAYKSAAWWTHFVPWMAIFDGVGNAATNTRVELRPLKAYYKSRASGQWILLSQGQIDGQNYPKYLNAVQSGSPDIVPLGGGAVSVRPPGTELHFHGWSGARALPDPTDIAAIHVTTQARLAIHDPQRPDDRALARYLVQVGADYYPDASLNLGLFAPDTWNPGVGLSRSKRIGTAWQSYSFTTIDVGVQVPGGAAITEAELRRAPPPID